MSGHHYTGSLEADLRTMPPQNLSLPDDVTSITIGDLHGNFLKLLYLLLAGGIVKLDAGDYSQLVSIYDTLLDALTSEHIEKFDHILASLSIERADILIRLIGDELADRGRNDYFTLALLARLQLCGIAIEIIASNHGMEFYLAHYKGGVASILPPKWSKNNQMDSIVKATRTSLFSLKALVQKGLICAEKVQELVTKHHQPQVKLLSYEENDDNTLILYSHAPIGWETIMGLLSAFNLEQQYPIKRFTGKSQLTGAIDAINMAFSRCLSDVNFYTDFQKITRGERTQNTQVKRVYDAIWRRAKTDRPLDTRRAYLDATDGNRLQLQWVHGHDGRAPADLAHVTNLDCQPLGKDDAGYYQAKKAKPTDYLPYLKSKLAAYQLRESYYQEMQKMLNTFSNKKGIDEYLSRMHALMANRAKYLEGLKANEDGMNEYWQNKVGELSFFVTSSAERPLSRQVNWRPFEQALAKISNKATELCKKAATDQSYLRAKETALLLHQRLRILQELQQQNLLDMAGFKAQANVCITAAEQELSRCRTNVKPILVNLRFAILTLGFGLIYNTYCLFRFGHFWQQAKAASKQEIIDVGTRAVEALNPPAGQTFR